MNIYVSIVYVHYMHVLVNVYIHSHILYIILFLPWLYQSSHQTWSKGEFFFRSPLWTYHHYQYIYIIICYTILLLLHKIESKTSLGVSQTYWPRLNLMESSLCRVAVKFYQSNFFRLLGLTHVNQITSDLFTLRNYELKNQKLKLIKSPESQMG